MTLKRKDDATLAGLPAEDIRHILETAGSYSEEDRVVILTGEPEGAQ